MKNLLILCLSGLAIAVAPQLVWAQGRNSEPAPNAAQQLVEEIGLDRFAGTTNALAPAGARTLSVLRQTGSDNRANIEQVSLGTAPNQALVVQAGAANVAGLNQYGSGNAAALVLTGDRNSGDINQLQNANSFNGDIKGDRNTLNVLQDGNSNHSKLDAEGTGRTYNITQVGDRNNLTQIEGVNSTAPLGYDVKMVGHDMHVTILQGRTQP